MHLIMTMVLIMMMEIVIMINKRHEYKYKINAAQARVIKGVLDPLLKYDKHSDNGYYDIHSLYFDDIDDKAYMDKLNGVNKRAKFRIRYYNNDLSYINLEKKSKANGLGSKQKLRLSEDEVKLILNNQIDFLLNKGNLGIEFYCQIKTMILRPKVIISYRRLAYYYPYGNVRITIDDNLTTQRNINEFLECKFCPIPIDENAILEVKYDAYLPDFIAKVLSKNLSLIAYSKYQKGRNVDLGENL